MVDRQMQRSMHYFAYGSNMLRRRLETRTPAAVRAGTGRLAGYRLRFNKLGRKDQTAKCNIEESPKNADHVLGVVYPIVANRL